MKQGSTDNQAEELVQETMLNIWRKSKQFNPEKASASTWIYTIARNLKIDAFRRNKRPTINIDDIAEPIDNSDGADKKVFVVSPLSLLPLLSLVSEAWRQFQLSTNANQAIQIAKDLTDRLKIYEDKYQAVGSKILALGKAYNSSVSSYNARLKPSVRNLQKLQGQPQDLMDMENVPVDVTPVIESLEADNEEE